MANMSGQGQEQRLWQRASVTLEAKYRDQEKIFTRYFRADLLDIHHQGCRLVGGARFAEGDRVSVLVDLPNEGTFHFEAVAVWSKPVYKDRVFETGVRFLTDDPINEETYLKLFHIYLTNLSRH